MSVQRKRGVFNEQVKLAHERKEWVEENRRIDRMQYEACMGVVQKRKRSEAIALSTCLRLKGNSQAQTVSL